jgi:hypothetical protein
MSLESFRSSAYVIIARMLDEASNTSREELLDATLDQLEEVYARESHQLLNQVLDDARVRLDARLSPDPVNQTIASVQTTMQDLFDTLWRP